MRKQKKVTTIYTSPLSPLALCSLLLRRRRSLLCYCFVHMFQSPESRLNPATIFWQSLFGLAITDSCHCYLLLPLLLLPCPLLSMDERWEEWLWALCATACTPLSVARSIQPR